MTRILDRYVARQVLISASFAVVIILIILILGNVFKEILRELSKRPDLSLNFVFKFIGLIVPIALSLALPFSFLAAILLTFSKLSADNELVSMRMAGLSMGRICMPIAFISIFFSAICCWINLSIAPWAKSQMEGMKDTLINKAKRDPMLLIQDEQVMNEFPGVSIYANKEDGVLKDFQMVANPGSNSQTSEGAEAIAMAKQAKLRIDFDSNQLIIEMDDANLMVKKGDGDFFDSAQPSFFKVFPYGVPLDSIASKVMKVKPESLGFKPLLENARDKNLEPKERAVFLTELSKRMAFSVSCITFALIGVPLGITAQRRESTAGFFISLILAVIYYSLLNAAGGKKDDPEFFPHLLVWIPNVLFVGIGLFLFIRVSRR